MPTVTAYLGDWEFHFDVSKDQMSELDQLVRQLGAMGFNPKRPYVQRGETEFTPQSLVFDRYESRTDGKKGDWAIALDATGKEVKVVSFQKVFKKGLPVVTQKNEKGYIEFGIDM